MILDRSFDIQATLANDYSYQSLIYETIENIEHFCLDKVDFLKKSEQSNFLNDTDFVWSRYKCSDIVEFQKLISKEVEELKNLQNIMIKKSDKGGQDDMADIVRDMPEKQLKE